jgi:hypothetical protein
MRHVVLFVFALSLMAGTAFAQTAGTGAIQGTVTDPSGAAVPGAAVTATNVATGTETSRTTTGAGYYVLPLLDPGEYTVTVKATGFETLTQLHVIVDALATVAVDPKLQIGATTQTVTVRERPTVLNADDAVLGSAVENQIYDSLPLAMNASARDPSAFAGLAIGVDNYSTQAAGPSTGAFNGGQTYQNETYIEGQALTSAGTESDTRNLAFGISVEAVEQFQVETAGAKSMYEGQGVANYVIKSGTNQFHGGVYEYFRNTDFDARNFFSPTRSPEHQNEFGVNIGGPIKKDKAFFFSNYDGYRYVSAIAPVLQNIPTVLERQGNFSEFVSGTTNAIYDPTSATGTGVRTQFVGNIITSPLSKVAQSFQSYLPAPTYSGITSNYLATLPNDVNNDSTTNKVDYNLTNKNRMYAVYSRGKYANPTVGSLAAGTATTNSTLPIPYTDGRSVVEYSTLAQFHDNHIISTTMVNQFSLSLSRLFIPLLSNTASGGYPGKAGLTGLPPGIASTGFPDMSWSGNDVPVQWDGTNSHAYNESQTTYDMQDNVIWNKGKHAITVGFQWQALQDNENTPLTGTQAGFTFTNTETENFTAAGAPIANTGLAYASFLLGLVDASTVTWNSVAETGGRYKTYAFYVNDDYKITPRLTLNLGLRWDLWGVFTEKYNHLSFLNPTLANPVAGNIPGALQFAGSGTDSCNCKTPVQNHFVNPGPRIGLAYRLGDKTVIRSSFSIFYAHAGGVGGRTDGRQGLSQIGFDESGGYSSSATGQPAYNWNSGYPGNPLSPPFINPSYGDDFVQASAPGAAAGFIGPTTGTTMPYGDPLLGGKPPYYEDWSFNIQRSLTHNMQLSVAYSASAGHWLPGAGVAGEFTNQIPVQYLPLQATLGSTLVSTAGVVNSSVLSTVQASFPNFKVPFPYFTGTVAQALKPFPQYSGVSDPYLDVGNSNYNALQISANQRLSHGLSYMVNYTYSKELDDLIASPRDPNADFLEYAPGTIDHPHVATATWLYQLPFGAGRDFNSGNKALSSIISHWQVAGIFTFASGAPMTITSGNCTSTSGVINATCYPNYNTSYTGSVWTNGSEAIGKGPANVSTTPYLNKTAFTDPAAYTWGDVARSAPDHLFAPHNADMDLSVRREFKIREQVRLALQADAFNVNNAVHFSAPGTLNMDSASFGLITSVANLPRKLQFSGRITF